MFCQMRQIKDLEGGRRSTRFAFNKHLRFPESTRLKPRIVTFDSVTCPKWALEFTWQKINFDCGDLGLSAFPFGILPQWNAPRLSCGEE